jgi:riboflavin synthase
MFTGLVEARGKLAGRGARGPGAQLSIECGFSGLVLGESIAVDGVCLTVERITARGFDADASAETLARSTLGALPIGAGVNLERAMPLGGRMGGHIVGGHVDGVGQLTQKRPVGDAVEVTFAFPPELAKYIAEKGSIAVNGISLTVNAATTTAFTVMLIPVTQSLTGLDKLAPGAAVNLEVDVLARYVVRQLELAKNDAPAGRDATLLAALKGSGYL